MTYSYDRYGNLLSKQNAPPQGGGSTTTFSVDSITNRVVSYSTWPVTFTFNVGYDASGNMTTRSEKAYDWDGAGRLMRVRRPSDGAQYGNHRYDAFGRRVRRAWDYPIGGGPQQSTGSIVYVYGAGGELAAEYRNVTAGPSGAEASTTYNIQMGDATVAKRVTGTIYGQPYERTEWLHRNHLQEVVGKDYSNVSGCTDCSGWTWTYAQPFGSGGSDQFQGHKDDAETYLKYFGSRYYDAGIAYAFAAGSLRWTSPDSITTRLHDPQSLNKYAYVRNDPVNLIDPDGRMIQGPEFAGYPVPFFFFDRGPENPTPDWGLDPVDRSPRSGGPTPEDNLRAFLANEYGLRYSLLYRVSWGYERTDASAPASDRCESFLKALIASLGSFLKEGFTIGTLIDNILAANRQVNSALTANARTTGNTIEMNPVSHNSMGNDWTSTLLHEGFHLAMSASGGIIDDEQLAMAIHAAGLPQPLGTDWSAYNTQMFSEQCGPLFP